MVIASDMEDLGSVELVASKASDWWSVGLGAKGCNGSSRDSILLSLM